MGKKEFLRDVAALTDGLRADMVKDRAVIGEAALAVIAAGTTVTVETLIAEVERRMDNPPSNDLFTCQNYEAAAEILRRTTRQDR